MRKAAVTLCAIALALAVGCSGGDKLTTSIDKPQIVTSDVTDSKEQVDKFCSNVKTFDEEVKSYDAVDPSSKSVTRSYTGVRLGEKQFEKSKLEKDRYDRLHRIRVGYEAVGDTVPAAIRPSMDVYTSVTDKPKRDAAAAQLTAFVMKNCGLFGFDFYNYDFNR